MEDPFFIAGCSILALGTLGSVALIKGINGKVMTTVVGAICTIAGYCFGAAT